MIKNCLLVGIGGFIGSVGRYLISTTFSKFFPILFPIGTFSVNILGSFIIGLVYGLSEEYISFQQYRLFLATGICGGFTTFSSFTAENLALIQKGEWWMFLSYTFMSVLLGILAVLLGIWVSKLKF
jgi:CrcB protein